jgi:RNA polymerase sigma-70 factor (ECF subfamily)
MAKDPIDLIPTRVTLLGRLKNWDDQESWREFFNTYWKLIYEVAIKAGLTDTEAQEVVQETVILVAKKMPEFKYDPAVGSFKSWLLHTTRWRVNDQFRKRHVEREAISRRPTDTSRTATIERVPDPAGLILDDVWNKEWQKNLFDAAIERVKGQVSARQYQMFDLYVVKQWPVLKVATRLGVNIGRIYLAKHRIAALIKKEVKKLETKLI